MFLDPPTPLPSAADSAVRSHLAGLALLFVRNKMPRLGDDPNMATAYPNRVNTNLRGGWMRQMLYTMVMTFVLYKVVFTDYKVSFEF